MGERRSRHFIPVGGRLVHVAEQGAGRPVLLIHQTPRSSDEFREVLPLLARAGCRAIAPDTPGFGESEPLDGPGTIEGWADALEELISTLGLPGLTLVGHHTRGVVALELAARGTLGLDALVLSSTPYVDADERARRAAGPPVDEPTLRGDGSHLLALWHAREGFYPEGRPDLLERYVLDALRAGPRAREGHAAVGRYTMETRAALVAAPTLLIGADADPFAFPHLASLGAAIPRAKQTVIAGGMVPLPDGMPDAFADAVLSHVPTTPTREERA